MSCEELDLIQLGIVAIVVIATNICIFFGK